MTGEIIKRVYAPDSGVMVALKNEWPFCRPHVMRAEDLDDETDYIIMGLTLPQAADILKNAGCGAGVCWLDGIVPEYVLDASGDVRIVFSNIVEWMSWDECCELSYDNVSWMVE